MRNSNTSHKRSCAHLGAILVAVLAVQDAAAIDPARAMSQYVRERWTTDRGFPSGPVYAITQTPDGYLWIGTEAGLLRFDGWNFNLASANVPLFQSSSVIGLLPDAHSNLWIRLLGPRLLVYRNGRYEDPTANQRYSNVTAMSLTNRGSMLAAVGDYGASVERQGRFETLTDWKGLPRSPVIAMAQTTNGDIWMGTRDAGLFRTAGGRFVPVTTGLPDPKINCLLAGPGNELFVGTDSGVVRWDGRELTPVVQPSGRRLQALAMVRDKDGNLWVGTDSRGLLRINRSGVSELPVGNRQAVTALFEDREGSLWIGSDSAIERLRDSDFVTYSSLEGLPVGGSSPVFADARNRIWFAPAAGGLWWFKDGEHGQVAADGLASDIVYSIAGTADELWIGRQHGGLTRLHVEGGSIAAATYTHRQGLAQDSVYSVFRSRDGTLWAGTLSAGVSRFRKGAFVTYTVPNGLASNAVASILETSDGAMWFATPTGLSELANGVWRTWTTTDGLPSDNVNCLLEDSGGVQWAGTSAGLTFRRSSRFEVPRNHPPSLAEPILGIAEDRYGWLWVSTSNHVLRVRRDGLLNGDATDRDVRSYGVADGLRGIEGVKRDPSVVKDLAGRIWFSTNQGVSVVDPARLTAAAVPAIPRIQSILADGKSIGLEQDAPRSARNEQNHRGFYRPGSLSPRTGSISVSTGRLRSRLERTRHST